MVMIFEILESKLNSRNSQNVGFSMYRLSRLWKKCKPFWKKIKKAKKLEKKLKLKDIEIRPMKFKSLQGNILQLKNFQIKTSKIKAQKIFFKGVKSIVNFNTTYD